jgi:hypothetical protein
MSHLKNKAAADVQDVHSFRSMYHVQEKRKNRLVNPVKCNRSDAWLGSGYYFWLEEVDAIA